MSPIPFVNDANGATESSANVRRGQEARRREDGQFHSLFDEIYGEQANHATVEAGNEEVGAGRGEESDTNEDDGNAGEESADSGEQTAVDDAGRGASTAHAQRAAVVAGAMGIRALNFELLSGGATAAAEKRLVTAQGRSESDTVASKRGGAHAVARDVDSERGGRSSPIDEVEARPTGNLGRSQVVGDAQRDERSGAETNESRGGIETETHAVRASDAPEPRDRSVVSAQQAERAPTDVRALSGNTTRAIDALRRLVVQATASRPQGETGSGRVASSGLPSVGGVSGMNKDHAAAARTNGRSQAQLDGMRERAETVSIQLLRSVNSALARTERAGVSTPVTDSALISLRPASLGQVKVRVEVTEGVVSASFESRSELAHELLRSSVAELRTQLEASGMKVDRLEVVSRAEPTVPVGLHVAETTGAVRDAHGVAGQGASDEAWDTDNTSGRDGQGEEGTPRDSSAQGRGGEGERGENETSAEADATGEVERSAGMLMSGLVDAIA